MSQEFRRFRHHHLTMSPVITCDNILLSSTLPVTHCSTTHTYIMSQSIEAPVFALQYGDIELVIAEPTLSHNTAPFTIFSLSDDNLNAVEDTVLLDAFQSQFNRLEELLPKSIPMLRAYATLIIFYRISRHPTMDLTFEQAKARLMGENAEDTLLFIVAKLLRHDDHELRRYLQQPHILVSSLLKVKQDFILGEGNVIRLFQRSTRSE